jgi:hypothetical protein
MLCLVLHTVAKRGYRIDVEGLRGLIANSMPATPEEVIGHV